MSVKAWIMGIARNKGFAVQPGRVRMEVLRRDQAQDKRSTALSK
jgi:hypothetical protein